MWGFYGKGGGGPFFYIMNIFLSDPFPREVCMRDRVYNYKAPLWLSLENKIDHIKGPC